MNEKDDLNEQLPKPEDPETAQLEQDGVPAETAQLEQDGVPAETAQLEQDGVPAEEAETENDASLEEEFEKPLDQNIKLMSPGKMVARRFFRSKLSIIGLVMIAGLLIFCWLGPVICNWAGYEWGETTVDNTPFVNYGSPEQIEVTQDGETFTIYQVLETTMDLNTLASPSASHLLGTDKSAMDVFVRLMYGGRVSLSVSVLTVFVIAFIGIVFGGIAGYFGGKVDNVIMRICDILMCIPGLPILLIVSSLLGEDGFDVEVGLRIYYLMGFLTLISWSGTARLVRGQILSLREQEYMVAAEAMGFSVPRKIFKHLVPNVLPQLIVSMTLSLGSMILYEASLSYLGMGVPAPEASWGTMISIVTEDTDVLQHNFNVWVPPGICIILTVLGFNFIGDGLRDALDPKMRR